MGQLLSQVCDTDYFRDLLLKYGELFICLIVSEKMKQFLQEKFQQVMAIIKEYVDRFVRKVNEIVDEKFRELREMFEELKESVEKMFPGKIAEMEQKRGMNIDAFTGFSGFLLKINEVCDESLLKVQEEHKEISTELQQKKVQVYTQIEEQRPKVPVYESLSQSMKLKMFRKAEKEFGEMIEEGQMKMREKCDGEFGGKVEKMEGVFEKINPERVLSGILEKMKGDVMGMLGLDVKCGGCGMC